MMMNDDDWDDRHRRHHHHHHGDVDDGLRCHWHFAALARVRVHDHRHHHDETWNGPPKTLRATTFLCTES